MSVPPARRRLGRLLLSVLLLFLALGITPQADDPPAILDMAAERARLFGTCQEMLDTCNRQNCDQHDYSGCAVDCVGCFGPTVGWPFVEKNWNLHPSYGTCAVAILEAYISEVASIHSQFLARTITLGEQGTAERAVRDVASEGLNTCLASACDAHCADLGRTGGFRGWDCVCDPIPEATADASGDEQVAEDDADSDGVSEDAGSRTPTQEADATVSDETSPPESVEPSSGTADREADDSTGDASGGEWWEDVDAEGAGSAAHGTPPRPKSFRIRPVNAVSVGELIGYVRVTYEIQEVYDDGTTGRRCTLRYSGWGAMVGLPVGFSFAPGYQWSELPVRSGRMSLEDFNGIAGYHSSAGGLLGGWSGFYFGHGKDYTTRRAQSSGGGWNVGLWLGLDWTWGKWEIVDGPTAN